MSRWMRTIIALIALFIRYFPVRKIYIQTSGFHPLHHHQPKVENPGTTWDCSVYIFTVNLQAITIFPPYLTTICRDDKILLRCYSGFFSGGSKKKKIWIIFLSRETFIKILCQVTLFKNRFVTWHFFENLVKSFYNQPIYKWHKIVVKHTELISQKSCQTLYDALTQNSNQFNFSILIHFYKQNIPVKNSWENHFIAKN